MNENVRSRKDIDLFKKLNSDPLIKKSLEILDKHTDQAQEERTRRHLLKSSIKLSQSVSPELYEISQHCTKTLGVEIPLELYVYSSAD